MNKIMNGKEVSLSLKENLKSKIEEITDKLKLVVIQVGNNAASNIYVSKKEKLCQEMKIDFLYLKYDQITESKLIKEIEKLNQDKSVTGILVQLPLPQEINETKVIEAIDYKKDVDGLTSYNIGRLYNKEFGIIPCTALGIMKLLDYYKVPLTGKNVTIIGRTKLIGIPLFKLLLDKNCTVTMCHSKTLDLKKYTKSSDIIITAAGKKSLITKNMIKKGSIVIDVSINREENLLCGDACFNEILSKVSLITPVPGGVGPMTVIMLINNILECYYLQ